jgi:hypothetical protein
MKTKKKQTGFAAIDTGSKELQIRCITCHKPTTNGPYSFAGGIACESCVRAHYHYLSPAEIAEKLRCRNYESLRLRSNRSAGSRR